MRHVCIAILAAGMLSAAVCSAQAQSNFAPPNPAFTKMLAEKRANKSNPAAKAAAVMAGSAAAIAKANHPKGAFPALRDLSQLAGKNVTSRSGSAARAAAASFSTTYPSGYDLRSLNKVSPVKSQGQCNGCWAFAAYGSLESNLLTANSYVFSENDMLRDFGFDESATNQLGCGGGDSTMATAYLNRWEGPVLESCDSTNFSYTAIPASHTKCAITHHMQEVLRLPPRASATDNDNIKWGLMNYGAVWARMYYDEANTHGYSGDKTDYYNDATAAYYYPGGLDANAGTNGSGFHALTIVGWNDNYLASNFNTGTQPPGNGAFIVKNSWGPDWGESGFFYVSYYDFNQQTDSNATDYGTGYGIGAENIVVNGAQPLALYDREYQYDKLGYDDDFGGSLSAWYANTFTATSNESLRGVGFYTNDSPASYTVYIYTGVTSAAAPTTGTLVYSASGSFTAPGFHTVDISTPVALASNATFSVVMHATNTSYMYPIPVEENISNYSSKATASNKSYMSSDSNGSPSGWTAVAGVTGYYGTATNVALKAYTYILPAAPATVRDGLGSSENSVATSLASLSANWDASSDSKSGISRYLVKITQGLNDITAWVDNGNNTSITVTGLSLQYNTAYRVAVKAVNGEGIESAIVYSPGQTTPLPPSPAPAYVYDGLVSGQETGFTASANTLSANWAAVTGSIDYKYAIGTTIGGTDVLTWTDASVSTYVVKSGLTLNAAGGVRYYFSVKSENSSNVWSSTTTSSGIVTDFTPPTLPILSTKPASASTATNPSFEWAATDTLSGVAGYTYELSTSNTWITSASTATTGTTASFSNLADSKYWFLVKAVDAVGNTSAATSYTFTVDTTSPTAPVLVSMPTAKITYRNPSFSWTATDALSGVASYIYELTTGGAWGSGTNVTTTASTTTFTNLQDGKYSFMIAANDAAGNSSSITSYSFTVDTSTPLPPAPAHVYDGSTTQETTYTRSNTTLSASWAPVSGAIAYRYAIGSAAGGTDIMSWTGVDTATSVVATGLSLSDNARYYFSVEDEDSFLSWSLPTTSPGILTDFTAPTAPTFTSKPSAVTNNKNLTFAWTSSDSGSGLASYNYELSLSSVYNSVTSTPTTGTSAIFSNVADGSYWFMIKAVDNAGNTSTLATYQFQVATTTSTPASPAYVYDGSSANETTYSNTSGVLSANWAAVSGNYGYRYAIGTTAGGTDILNWTNTNATSITKSGLNLADNTRYYFSVESSNNSTWSPATTSPGVLTDFTAPPTPTFTTEPTSSTADENPAFAWSSVDSGSGVANFTYELSTTGVFVAAVSTTTAATSAAYSGITDGTYWFLVKAKDNAGNTSPLASYQFTKTSTPVVQPSTPTVVNAPIRIYPNPCHMGSGQILKISGFTAQSENVQVDIYTVSGRLVRSLTRASGDVDANNLVSWHGINSSGEHVASGVYVMVIKALGVGTKVLNAAVLW